MASIVRFTQTQLPVNVKGTLKPDAQGRYEMPVGGLNVFNSVGERYIAEGALELFQESSGFMRRVKGGKVKAECGHPKKGNMTDDEYLTRIMRTEETNTCAFFPEIWLDFDWGRKHPELKSPDLIAIMAKVEPSGPRGDCLRQAFESEGQNVCFSIRSLTKDFYYRGINHRVLKTIFGFDWVTEPGISFATKFDSPALEDLSDELFIVKTQMERVIEKMKVGGVGTEAAQIGIEALQAFDYPGKGQSMPSFMKW
jgi:hypothetical protein